MRNTMRLGCKRADHHERLQRLQRVQVLILLPAHDGKKMTFWNQDGWNFVYNFASHYNEFDVLPLFLLAPEICKTIQRNTISQSFKFQESTLLISICIVKRESTKLTK